MPRPGSARPANRYGRSDRHLHLDLDVLHPRCDVLPGSGEAADPARAGDLWGAVRGELHRDLAYRAGTVGTSRCRRSADHVTRPSTRAPANPSRKPRRPGCQRQSGRCCLTPTCHSRRRRLVPRRRASQRRIARRRAFTACERSLWWLAAQLRLERQVSTYSTTQTSTFQGDLISYLVARSSRPRPDPWQGTGVTLVFYGTGHSDRRERAMSALSIFRTTPSRTARSPRANSRLTGGAIPGVAIVFDQYDNHCRRSCSEVFSSRRTTSKSRAASTHSMANDMVHEPR